MVQLVQYTLITSTFTVKSPILRRGRIKILLSDEKNVTVLISFQNRAYSYVIVPFKAQFAESWHINYSLSHFFSYCDICCPLFPVCYLMQL